MGNEWDAKFIVVGTALRVSAKWRLAELLPIESGEYAHIVCG